MDEGLDRILSFSPKPGQDLQLALNEYTGTLGILQLETEDRLDDLDTEQRTGFTKAWLKAERRQLKLASNEAVRNEPDPLRQLALHEDFQLALQKLDDHVNKPYMQTSEYQAAKASVEESITERRQHVETQFELVGKILDLRFRSKTTEQSQLSTVLEPDVLAAIDAARGLEQENHDREH